MENFIQPKLLGQILQKADLISFSQIQVALTDQEYNQKLRIGEILALRGWIEQQTADFFADEWQSSIEQIEKSPLGFYLEKSGLITEEQTAAILQEQKQIWLKFGSVAIIQGLIKETTLDFFLDNLFPLASSQSPEIRARSNKKDSKLQITAESKNNKTQDIKIDYDDIPWVD